MTDLCVVCIGDLIGYGMMAVIPLTSLAFNWRRLEMSKAMKQSWDWDGTKQTDGHVGAFFSFLDLL